MHLLYSVFQDAKETWEPHLSAHYKLVEIRLALSLKPTFCNIAKLT